MIDSALIFIKNIFNQHLINSFQLDNDAVILNNLTDPDGNVAKENQNKIVLTLINLQHETAKQYYGGQKRVSDAFNGYVQPDVHFNLDLLITAHFDNYDEALKFLTAIISYIHANCSLNRKNHPTLPEGITALNFEIENSPYEKTHNLWSALGIKYQPSIIYKIRHVTVSSDQIQSISSTVQEASAEALP